MNLMQLLSDNPIIALVVVIVILVILSWMMGWLGGSKNETYVVEVGPNDLQKNLYPSS